jgi:hypothetical protein
VKDTDIDWIISWKQMQFLGDAQWKGVKLDWGLTLQQKNEVMNLQLADERKNERPKKLGKA